MNESIRRFIDYASQTDKNVRNISIDDTVVAEFSTRTDAAKRIFVTGTGTSLPSAQYMAFLLQQRHNKQILFLHTAKMIRQIPKLVKGDVVIIISQGFNRADARIIYEGASKHCEVIVITGNRKPEVKANTLSISIPPELEKTFCRPISPVTTFIAIHVLFGGSIPVRLPEVRGLGSFIDWLNPAKQTILLYTADVSFGAELWNIVLREGAGINMLMKDIENYSHGYYGVDTTKLSERQFIILTSDSDIDRLDIARADGLYNLEGFNKHIIVVPGNIFDSNLALFVSAPKIVKSVILQTNRDMDHPIGMEENRKYHEYDRYTDYYPS